MSEQQTGVVDPQALFLVGMHYPNMFEEQRDENNRPVGFRCKVCNLAGIQHSDRQEHHERHRVDRANYATEQIRARKENNDMAKTKAPTPAEQGVPAVYLNADGTKFIPGKDASLKRDLIAAIDGLENPNALHTFTEQEAAKILAARDWNDWLVKSRKNREAKAAREKAKSEAKAAKVKDEVAAKRAAKTAKTETAEPKGDIRDRSSTVVKPDPKPERKPRTGGRKVGA